MESKGIIIESEKVLERKLQAHVKKLNGWTLKLLSDFVRGLPDRLILLPGGRVLFAEVKTTGKKPTKIQNFVHARLRELGFKVLLIDSSTKIKDISWTAN